MTRIERLSLFVLLAGQFVANVDTAIVNVATPAIGTTLGASGAALQLTVTAYVIASSALLITAARLGRLRGERGLFLGGLALFTVASLGCGFARDAIELIAARAVQGVGAAAMVAQVISGIQRTFRDRERERTRAVAASTASLSLSAVVGQIAGGALISANLLGLSWRPLFLINVPVGIVLLALGGATLPRSAPSPARLDVGGVMLFAVATIVGIFPLTLGREAGWPPWTFAALVVSLATAGAFVVRERR